MLSAEHIDAAEHYCCRANVPLSPAALQSVKLPSASFPYEQSFFEPLETWLFFKGEGK